MRFLFWNTNRNSDINSVLCDIIYQKKINIAILAEYKADIQDLVFQSSVKGLMMCEYATVGCDRIKMIGTFDSKRIAMSRQAAYYSMQIVDDSLLLCGVHLPSKLHATADKQELCFNEISCDVVVAELECQIENSIVVGDFNQNPYENGCLGAMGFHGIPVAEETAALSRTILRKKYKMFYNPMWNLLGDFDYPPGTYYCNSNEAINPFWNMFDQVIIRPQLREKFVESSLEIVTETNMYSLVDSKNRPNKKYSDHLPIIFEIRED